MVVADHGEGLGRHGEKTHGTAVYDSTMRVPFLLRSPGRVRAGTRILGPVSVVDVYPTFCEAMGLSIPDGLDGISLFQSEPVDGRGVYFESYFGHISFGRSHMVGWADRDAKFIHSSVPEFYEALDRGETDNLHAERTNDVTSYRAAIDRLSGQTRLRHDRESSPDELLKKQVEQLGYSGAGTEVVELPEPLEPSDRPSPHASLEIHNDFVRARSLMDRQRPEEAIEILQTVVAREATNHMGHYLLGQCLMMEGRYREAILPMQRAVATCEADWIAPYANLGLCYDHLGQQNEAIENYRQSLRLGTGPRLAIERLIELLRASGKAEEAETYVPMLEKAVQ